jgi:hypothetical protein
MNKNSFPIWLLRSPLHGMMSGSTLLITLTGRKSGKLIVVPVNYWQEGSTLWTTSKRDRTWWRNLGGGANVAIRLRGRDFNGFGELLLDEKVVAQKLTELLSLKLDNAHFFDVRLNPDKTLNVEDVPRAAKIRLIVKVLLDSEK